MPGAPPQKIEARGDAGLDQVLGRIADELEGQADERDHRERLEDDVADAPVVEDRAGERHRERQPGGGECRPD